MNLKASIDRFHGNNPYRVVSEDNEQRQQKIWRIRFNPGLTIPIEFGLLAGDIAHNLRSSLDHVAWVAAGSKANEQTAFPVWRRPRTPKPADLKSLAIGKVQGASKKIVSMMSSLQSYVGGDHQFIWEVDRLDIIDKHRSVLVALTSYESVGIDVGALMRQSFPESKAPPMTIGLRPAHRCPIHDGDELYTAPLDQAQKDEDVQFRFAIALGEPGPFECEPLVPKLTQLSDATTTLIGIFAAEL